MKRLRNLYKRNKEVKISFLNNIHRFKKGKYKFDKKLKFIYNHDNKIQTINYIKKQYENNELQKPKHNILKSFVYLVIRFILNFGLTNKKDTQFNNEIFL